jgi:hypothetical protein
VNEKIAEAMVEASAVVLMIANEHVEMENGVAVSVARAANLHARLLLMRAEMYFSAAAAVGDCTDNERDTDMAISSRGKKNKDGFRNRYLGCILMKSWGTHGSGSRLLQETNQGGGQ